jgi:hypothetical protein
LGGGSERTRSGGSCGKRESMGVAWVFEKQVEHNPFVTLVPKKWQPEVLHKDMVNDIYYS